MNPWQQFIEELQALSDRWVAEGRAAHPTNREAALIQQVRAQCGLEFTKVLLQGLERIQGSLPPTNINDWALHDTGVINHLAARVHAAWMAEKQRQGFADHPYDYRLHDGPRCCDKPHELHHADMVPFDQLSEATKEYDRATVRAVLAALIEEDTP